MPDDGGVHDERRAVPRRCGTSSRRSGATPAPAATCGTRGPTPTWPAGSGSSSRRRAADLDRRDRRQRQPVRLVGSTRRPADAVRHRQPLRLGPARRRRTTGRSAIVSRAPRRRRAARRAASTPGRPIGVAAFAEEEGSRFGVACLGSRLLTGALDPERALRAARPRRGHARRGDGRGRARTRRRSAPTRTGWPASAPSSSCTSSRAARWPTWTRRSAWRSAIWPHGRWRLDFTGEGNHAGTTRWPTGATRCSPSRTPCWPPNKEARLRGGARHRRPGRRCEPNATNAIPSPVSRLAGRAGRRPATPWTALVDGDPARGRRSGPRRDGTAVTMTAESVTPAVAVRRRAASSRLARRCSAARRCCRPAPGTTPACWPRHVPTAMLFVRNPTGVSHAPAEHATDADCAAGVAALADGARGAGVPPVTRYQRASTPGSAPAAGRRADVLIEVADGRFTAVTPGRAGRAPPTRSPAPA